jgi:glycosyltransferase involved in cell wall biosynthesis
MADRAVRTADAIGVLTRAAGDELLGVLPGLSEDRVVVLGAGVSEALRAEPTEAVRRAVQARLQLPERFVLSLATVEPRKGLDVLIEALGRLGTSAPQLVVVGQPGWGGVDAVELMRKAGLGPAAVRVLGKLSDEDLGVVMRSATMLAMPSRAEGFGLPVAEAMAVGTPVVCTDLPALVEIVGDAAELVPAGDSAALAAALEGLLSDDARRAALTHAGRSQATQHTWSAVANRAWALYRRLV